MSESVLVNRVIERAIAIQQIPAPTFAESARAAYVLRAFLSENLADVHEDEVGNILARLPGAGEAPPLIISAHLDTVFPAGTDLTLHRDAVRVYGPGIGDNSLGVAALFYITWYLRQSRRILPGDIWLVANVCEEGLGDLRGMQKIVNRFGAQVQAYLILEGMAFGQVYHRGLGVKRYRITAQTQGGHSWVDYGHPSAIHALAELVVQLAALSLPTNPRTSLNVGVFHGGTSVNTIAAQAMLELDLRSEGRQELEVLDEKVQELVARANQPEKVKMELELIGARPAGEIPADHPLVKLAFQAIQEQGHPANLNIGSTDANVPLSKGFPGITIGLTHGAGAHTVGEFIETAPLPQGLDQLLRLIELIFYPPSRS
jgi:acetylornithine deacetylase/succinyl-diaminopimelate desuccinylase-like protein